MRKMVAVTVPVEDRCGFVDVYKRTVADVYSYPASRSVIGRRRRS